MHMTENAHYFHTIVDTQVQGSKVCDGYFTHVCLQATDYGNISVRNS